MSDSTSGGSTGNYGVTVHMGQPSDMVNQITDNITTSITQQFGGSTMATILAVSVGAILIKGGKKK